MNTFTGSRCLPLRSRINRRSIATLVFTSSLLLLQPSFAVSQGALGITDLTALHISNGNKVVSRQPNLIHMVYAKSGSVFHTYSHRGHTWSPPVNISAPQTGCEQPTLAVTGLGVIGVAFVCNSDDLYYTSTRSQWCPFSAPEFIADFASNPAMIDRLSDAHLTWASQSVLYYTTFRALDGPAGATNQVVAEGPLCFQTTLFAVPSIAVSLDDQVYVSAHRFDDWTSANPMCAPSPPVSSGVNVYSKPVGGGFGAWGIEYENQRQGFTTAAGWVTTSIAVNFAGEVFLAFSDVYNGLPGPDRTIVAKRDAATGVWGTEPLVGLQSRIDIATKDEGEARAVLSVTGGSVCNVVETHEISWPSSGFSSDSISFQSSDGRDPNAIFYSRAAGECGGSPACSVELSYVDCGASAIVSEAGCSSCVIPPPVRSCAVCPAGPIVVGCSNAGKAGLIIKDGPVGKNKDQLKWTLRGTDTATIQDDLGNPAEETSYVMCAYDDGGATLVTSLIVAPSTAWTNKAPKGWKFKDKTGLSDGVQKILLKTGPAGSKPKVQVKAKGGNVPVSGLLPLTAPVTVQLFNNETGACWTSTLSVVKKNDSTQFKASGP